MLWIGIIVIKIYFLEKKEEICCTLEMKTLKKHIHVGQMLSKYKWIIKNNNRNCKLLQIMMNNSRLRLNLIKMMMNKRSIKIEKKYSWSISLICLACIDLIDYYSIRIEILKTLILDMDLGNCHHVVLCLSI